MEVRQPLEACLCPSESLCVGTCDSSRVSPGACGGVSAHVAHLLQRHHSG